MPESFERGGGGQKDAEHEKNKREFLGIVFNADEFQKVCDDNDHDSNGTLSCPSKNVYGASQNLPTRQNSDENRCADSFLLVSRSTSFPKSDRPARLPAF